MQSAKSTRERKHLEMSLQNIKKFYQKMFKSDVPHPLSSIFTGWAKGREGVDDSGPWGWFYPRTHTPTQPVGDCARYCSYTNTVSSAHEKGLKSNSLFSANRKEKYYPTFENF